jgi:hypothetical protein
MKEITQTKAPNVGQFLNNGRPPNGQKLAVLKKTLVSSFLILILTVVIILKKLLTLPNRAVSQMSLSANRAKNCRFCNFSSNVYKIQI